MAALFFGASPSPDCLKRSTGPFSPHSNLKHAYTLMLQVEQLTSSPGCFDYYTLIDSVSNVMFHDLHQHHGGLSTIKDITKNGWLPVDEEKDDVESITSDSNGRLADNTLFVFENIYFCSEKYFSS
jgi:hypothetical protein